MLLSELVDIFYDQPADLGDIRPITASQMPLDYALLLDHDDHMTVTMEAFHNALVDVRVLATRLDDQVYSRKIVLTRQSDGLPVLFGLVRLHWNRVDPDIRREIESCQMPLGRVLIRHNVLRHIELLDLWRVTPGPELSELWKCDDVNYGRTAIIHVEAEPAVELFEIVRPITP